MSRETSEFKAKWTEHIEAINGLKWNLPSKEWKEIDQIRSDLMWLVSMATINKEHSEKEKETAI